MSGDAQVRVAMCTVPDEAAGERIARQLLQERLIACANLLPAVRSLYWWEGRIDDGAEMLMLMKTTVDRTEALKQRLPALHPYDVPELLFLPVADGLEPYLGWVVSETTAKETRGTSA